MIRLLLLIIALGLVWWLLGFIPIPEPFHTIITVVMILIVIWEVLAMAGYVRSPWPYPPGPPPPP